MVQCAITQQCWFWRNGVPFVTVAQPLQFGLRMEAEARGSPDDLHLQAEHQYAPDINYQETLLASVRRSTDQKEWGR
jgi:hypothetical protein